MEQEIKKNTPRDVFLHLLAMVTLYWSSISFVTLVWQFVNHFLPDKLSYYSYDYSSSIIRFSVSSLVIVFPVFIAVSWFLNKIYRKESQVRESKIRKWLIYLTLFVTALVIIGDLIFVMNIFLGGEITTRFVLKALSVLLVAGYIFGYYLDDVRKEEPTKLAKPFAIIASILVLVVIMGAFFLVGSPNTARSLQFDQQRVENLNNIQSEIVYYWQSKEKLPENLSFLNNDISGFSVPKDPETNASYEYNIKDANNLTFELCATFNKESQENKEFYGIAMSQNWNHPAGRYCFNRTIDKELNAPFKTK